MSSDPFVGPLDLSDDAAAGVVDDDVDPPERLRGSRECICDLRLAGDIESEDQEPVGPILLGEIRERGGRAERRDGDVALGQDPFDERTTCKLLMGEQCRRTGRRSADRSQHWSRSRRRPSEA